MFNKAFKTTIVELIKSGNSMTDIWDEYNLSDRLVRRWIIESNL